MTGTTQERRSRKPEVIEARILDAAQAEFMAAGYAAASTNRVLAACGGSKATMFRYFPTKHALFEAVVARIADRCEAQIDWQHIEHNRPAAWLHAFATRALRWITTEENIFVGRLAIAEGAAIPAVGLIYRRLAVEPIEAILTDRLRHWHEASLLHCANPAKDAVSFLDVTLSGVVSRMLYRVHGRLSDDEIRAHVDQALDLFLHGRGANLPPSLLPRKAAEPVFNPGPHAA